MTEALDIVLLAAGRATRMRGADKMLETLPGPFGPVPLVAAMARRCAQAGRARVVLGPGQEARRAALADIPCTMVEAPAGAGLGASIAAGVSGGAGPVMLVLADMPEITAADLHLLATLAARAPEAILRAAAADGTPGHPVVFPADLRGALAALDGDTGARALLQAEAGRVVLLPLAGRRALTDLDTPEDWADWRTRAAPPG